MTDWWKLADLDLARLSACGDPAKEVMARVVQYQRNKLDFDKLPGIPAPGPTTYAKTKRKRQKIKWPTTARSDEGEARK